MHYPNDTMTMYKAQEEWLTRSFERARTILTKAMRKRDKKQIEWARNEIAELEICLHYSPIKP